MVSYRISIVTVAPYLAIRSQFAIEYLRRSNQRGVGVGQFGAKFVEEEVDRFKPNFKAVCERHGAVVSKRNFVDIFCRLSTMHERDRGKD